MKTIKCILVAIAGFSLLQSCTDYLDAKPDQSLSTPTTVKDLQALLENEAHFTREYTAAGDVAADYFYLSTADWAARNETERETYIWNPAADRSTDWNRGYQAVFYTNVVLDEIDDAGLGQLTEEDRRRVKGSAFFYRGWRYFFLSQFFAPPYVKETAPDELGVPLRLAADINLPTLRSSLQDTYGQIISDLQRAVRLLPVSSSTPTRPTRPAAYAALARVSLVMGEWDLAGRYADSCLSLQNSLIDYNSINPSSNTPFGVFNEEVILHNTMLSPSAIFTPPRAKVDSVLYAEYEEGDLRKTVLYYPVGNGDYAFKGDISGNGLSARLFYGLAVDEVYLIKAEAAIRNNNVEEALTALNTLLKKRFEYSSWVPIYETGVEDLLVLILKEREKSLGFRGGIRWSDLRRLNLDPRFARTLTREIDGQRFSLPPNDPRYTFLIPEDIIQMTGIPQNRR